MIIAWGMFIFGGIGLSICIVVAIKELLKDMLGYSQSGIIDLLFYFIITLCSAQYIWG